MGGDTVEHSPPGGVVVESGLKRIAGKLIKFKCGCSHDDTRWITFCDAVAQEVYEWRRVHRERKNHPIPIRPDEGLPRSDQIGGGAAATHAADSH